MRQIKFRAYDTIGERWLDSKELAIDLSGDWLLFDGTEYYPDNRHEYIALSQYTGLKDKNNTDIYEGDLLQLKHKNTSMVGEMKWDYGRNGWTIFSPLNEFEIIGNIYEDKELLNDNL